MLRASILAQSESSASSLRGQTPRSAGVALQASTAASSSIEALDQSPVHAQTMLGPSHFVRHGRCPRPRDTCRTRPTRSRRRQGERRGHFCATWRHQRDEWRRPPESQRVVPREREPCTKPENQVRLVLALDTDDPWARLPTSPDRLPRCPEVPRDGGTPDRGFRARLAPPSRLRRRRLARTELVHQVGPNRRKSTLRTRRLALLRLAGSSANSSRSGRDILDVSGEKKRPN